MDKEKLKDFVLDLQKVARPPKGRYDLGLMIKENKSKIDSEDILKKTSELVPIEKISYDDSIADEDIFEKIISAFENQKWIFLEIKKDPSSPLLNQLKHLANYNALQLIDYKGKDIFEKPMPENSRIIVFAERDFIENQISYPYFYTLFGPAISLK